METAKEKKKSEKEPAGNELRHNHSLGVIPTKPLDLFLFLHRPILFSPLNMVEEHATAVCAHGPRALGLITERLPFSPDILDYYYLSDISAPERRVYKELIT